MTTKIQQMKEELNTLAKSIREQKIAFKNAQREQGNYKAYLEYGRDLTAWQREFRHKHIAYCLLRGRTIEEIENKNREGNEPDQHLIKQYCEEYKDEEETLHSNAA